MVMTMGRNKGGPPTVSIRVRTWHPVFWWVTFRALIRTAVYNRAFAIVSRYNDHVRIWQNGEECIGCEEMYAKRKAIRDVDMSRLNKIAERCGPFVYDKPFEGIKLDFSEAARGLGAPDQMNGEKHESGA
jgi:hypothetical protein